MEQSSSPRRLSRADRWIAAADNAVRTLAGTGVPAAATPTPPDDAVPEALTEAQRRLSGALMRVNHVGEVCAQALYQGQALSTRNPALQQHFTQAAQDETQHLAWAAQRLRELGARRSLLDPLWYAGSFGLGLLAGRTRDAYSLGFVAETERQVEQHLQRHLERLPADDLASRAVVARMQADEARHAAEAEQAGAARLPWPVRLAMRAAAKVMTTTAHRL